MSESEPNPKPTIDETMTGAESLPVDSFRGALEVFGAAVEAEERKKLVAGLLDKGLGVPSVEYYHRKQGSTKKVAVSKNKNQRNKPFISRDMRLKLSDAIRDVKNRTRAKIKVMKRIKTELGDERGKLFIEELTAESEKLRQRIQNKNLKKTQHLSTKFLPDEGSVPDILSRYRDCQAFGVEEEKNSLHTLKKFEKYVNKPNIFFQLFVKKQVKAINH